MPPLVSVITPAFNAARTLDRAHASLRAQTIETWEHIIINDGSLDGTAEIVRSLSADPRVSGIDVPNRGPGRSL